MLGATLYLVGFEMPGYEYVTNSSSCAMCKRMIINAGIECVVIRDTAQDYRMIAVQDWVENDESLEGIKGY
jgi:dCMP deaminase